MVRVKDLDAALHFYTTLFGMVEIRRYENDKGRFTLVFLAARAISTMPAPTCRPASSSPTTGIRKIMTAAAILAISPMRSTTSMRPCQTLMDAGVIINRPPRDGHMAFVRSPDGNFDRNPAEGRQLGRGRTWLR